ncbi:MAG: hypothetical protein ACLP1X_12615 [Polyangiaceae bacterium]|jgi:hypothetical protein
MESKKIVHLGGKWSGAVLALACVVGCNKTKAQADDASADAEMVGAAAPDSDAETFAAAEAPPAPLVAADPNIPLNEAVVGAAPVPTDYSAAIAPPAPVVEDEPVRPEADDAWIPGYWWWSGPLDRYVWVSGAWRHPPPDQYWSPGAWNLVNGRYFWAPGYWGPHGYAREYIDVAPPALRFEAYIAPPGVGFTWTPGYYGYRGGAYAWIGGSWLRPPREGVNWVEPRYVTIGGRYCLQPGRWDFAPERRGTVYRPDINVRAGAHLSLAPVPQVVVSAHATFVTAAAHAIAHGATRTPSGGYVVAHVGGNVHGNVPQAGVEVHGAVVPTKEVVPMRENEPHAAAGGNEPRNEPRPEAVPKVEPEAHGATPKEEPHPGAAPKPEGEAHPGAAPRVEAEGHAGTAPKETPTRAAPVEEHRGGAAPAAHGAPPAVEHAGTPPAHGHPPEKKK